LQSLLLWWGTSMDDGTEYETEGRASNSQFFIWQLILFVGLVVAAVAAWPHLFNQG